MPVVQMLVEGETDYGPLVTRQIHKGGLPCMCGQHIVRAAARDNTGQNKDKGHTPSRSPRIEINIPDPARKPTRISGLEDRQYYI